MDSSVYHSVCVSIHLHTCICMENGALFGVFGRTSHSMHKSEEIFMSYGSMFITYARSRSKYINVDILNVFVTSTV
jgi:hypothetical protein